MAVEGLLLQDCKGKVTARSLETSGFIFPRTCRPMGFTSRKQGVLGGAEQGGCTGIAATSPPSICTHAGSQRCTSPPQKQHPTSCAERGRGDTLPDTNTRFCNLGRQHCCAECPAINPKVQSWDFPAVALAVPFGVTAIHLWDKA